MTKIEIDLRDLGLPAGEDEDGPHGSKSLQDLIIDAASDKLLGSNYELRRDLREDIARSYRDKINERVAALIEEAFAAPIQKTTRWGETQGEETTVKEIIREQIEAYLKNGAPSRPGYSTDKVSLTALIQNEVVQILGKEMKEHIAKVKGEIKLEVQKKALAAAVAELTK